MKFLRAWFLLSLGCLGWLSTELRYPQALWAAETPPSLAPAGNVYHPIPLPSSLAIEDTLTERDIPTGKGGFARDYTVELKEGDQIAIDLVSDSFDTLVTLMAPNGTTLGENDDGPDGGTNSLLFMRISQTGSYIVRVQAFGRAKGGPFMLKLTRLKPS